MRTIAGFFRRGTAEVVDALVLVAIGCALCLILFDPLSRLGLAGQLVGFAIVVIYYGVLDSRWGAGQSLGKRLLHITVVDRTGALLAPWRAFLRAAVFGGLWLCNGLGWFFEVRAPWVASALGNAGVVLLLATVLLYLFNARTRQSLHDLAVKSYVVWDRAPPMPTDPSKVAVLATAGCLLPLVVLFQLSAQHFAAKVDLDPDTLPTWAATKALRARPDVVRAHLFVTTPSDDPTETVYVWAWMAQPVRDEAATAASIAATVRDQAPSLVQDRHIRVRLIRNVTLGIFSLTRVNQLVPIPIQP